MKLNPRDQQIFSAVMSLYCNGEGLPVASSRIAKQKGMAVCSATVRNAMARLEKEGLLYSPHTSAGRVPTNEGFEYWLSEFFELPQIATYWQPQQAQLVELAHGLSQRYKVCCCVGLPQVSSQLVFVLKYLILMLATGLFCCLIEQGKATIFVSLNLRIQVMLCVINLRLG